MSGRRMKALRRAAFGDLASNAASKVYEGDEVRGKKATTKRYAVPVVTEGKDAGKLIGHRQVTLRGGAGSLPVKLAGEAQRRYRDMKKGRTC